MRPTSGPALSPMKIFRHAQADLSLAEKRREPNVTVLVKKREDASRAAATFLQQNTGLASDRAEFFLRNL